MGIKRKPDDEPTVNSSRSCISKPKSCKYDQSYLSFGFVLQITVKNDLSVFCVSVS
jgi:hypothetical protein